MTLPHPAGDPYQHPFGTLRHYYGDVVRTIFVAVAIMVGVIVPFSSDLTTGVIVGAPAIVLLLVLAGLTSPHGRVVLALNAIAAGLGVVLTQAIALGAYARELYPLFAFLEFMSVLLMIALYFSVKTVRASVSHKIGKVDGLGEFDDNNL